MVITGAAGSAAQRIPFLCNDNVGPKFGDDSQADEAFLAGVRANDMELLKSAAELAPKWEEPQQLLQSLIAQ